MSDTFAKAFAFLLPVTSRVRPNAQLRVFILPFNVFILLFGAFLLPF